MTSPHELDIENGVFDDALVLVAVPGAGFVGTIAAQFVMDQLRLKQVGSVHTSAGTPGVVARRGAAGARMVVYGGPEVCGPGSSCRHVAVITADVSVVAERAAEFAQALVSSLAQVGARAVVLLDALRPHAGAGAPPVIASGVGPDAGMHAEAAGVSSLGRGAMAGFGGAALLEGLERDANVVALLTPATPDEPDTAAASRLLGAVVKLVRIALDTTPLEENARRAAKKVQERRGPAEPSMYA
ncbi:MAG: PAC2 family protein [Methanobacteriota archaeon]